MKENYTIKDIAQLAGVSKGTVDRVIHNRGKVSQKALEKVNEVLDKIEYKPNPIAKSLKNNKVYSIAIILPDATYDPYWKPCYEGIIQAEKEFNHFGIKINRFQFAPSDTDSFITTAERAIDSKPDAILMVPLFYKEAEEIAKKCLLAKIKVATFNNYIKDNKVHMAIGQDLFQSGRVAAKLFDLMLTPKAKIAIVHVDESIHNASHMQEKEEGFKSYFKNSENTVDVLVHNLQLENNPDFKTTIKTFIESKELDGVFVTTSKAYLLAQHLYSHSKKCILIGYDLVEDNLKYLTEGNISFLIHQDPKKQVYLCLTHLIEHFLFDKKLPEQLRLPIDIINAENYLQYVG